MITIEVSTAGWMAAAAQKCGVHMHAEHQGGIGSEETGIRVTFLYKDVISHTHDESTPIRVCAQ